MYFTDKHQIFIEYILKTANVPSHQLSEFASYWINEYMSSAHKNLTYHQEKKPDRMGKKHTYTRKIALSLSYGMSKAVV